MVHHPQEGYLDPKKRYFVVSRKSEKESARSEQTTASVCFCLAVTAGLIAATCLILALRVV